MLVRVWYYTGESEVLELRLPPDPSLGDVWMAANRSEVYPSLLCPPASIMSFSVIH